MPISHKIIHKSIARNLLLLSIPLFSIISCKDKSLNTTKYSLRDTILSQYFTLANNTGEIDTTEDSYTILKAYTHNDTDALKRISKDLRNIQKSNEEMSDYDSCIHQKKLQNLNIDTGYRFIYDRAFCDYKINATLTKAGDSAKLNFIVYQPTWGQKECKVISEFDKYLSQKTWNELMYEIEKSDFWGLKKLNGVMGVDGDGLTMSGFIKGNPEFSRSTRYKYVYRWAINSTSLERSFHLLLKISGNKKGCIWAE